VSNHSNFNLDASPEIIGGHPYTGPEVDMWSMGVMLYAMLVGAHAFPGNPDKVRSAILAGTYTIPHDMGLSPESIDLIKGLLTRDQHKRLTVEEVIRHKWLRAE